jgi:hypothetical protein
MKKVLLTTTAIVGLTAPAFAADPTAVSDQPYFHHSHPMTWSGSMSIKLTNQSKKDSDETKEKSAKKNFVFGHLVGVAAGEEAAVGALMNEHAEGARHTAAQTQITTAQTNINAHASYNLTTAISDTEFSSVEDVIDDFLGGSYS